MFYYHNFIKGKLMHWNLIKLVAENEIDQFLTQYKNILSNFGSYV